MADNSKNKMKFNATWSMAVGGMVGGGIFSVLGVVIDLAGQWSWLSFLIAGIIALISAHSYSQLSMKYGEGGGAFIFLRKINHDGFAGSVSWILILGYILTISVYGFTFGHYVAHVFNLGAWFPRFLALAVIGSLALLNLQGVSNSARVEIATVWGKLFVLIGLAAFGLSNWDFSALSEGVESKSWISAIAAAATIFMAYEGFQLLSYDYEDISEPNRILPLATLSAVIVVIAVYILTTLGATMIVGAETIVEKKEIALSIAGQKALGTIGLILVTIAAGFSTGSAINATLFSTARLMENVAKKKDLPHLFARENSAHIPFYSICAIAGLAAALSVLGNLGALVDAASLVFLFTFAIVNFLAFRQRVRLRHVSLLGAAACAVAMMVAIWHQLQRTPVTTGVLIGLCVLIAAFRPTLLKWMNAQDA